MFSELNALKRGLFEVRPVLVIQIQNRGVTESPGFCAAFCLRMQVHPGETLCPAPGVIHVPFDSPKSSYRAGEFLEIVSLKPHQPWSVGHAQA